MGAEISHAYHHSYLEEAMVQQGYFHLHLLSFEGVHHSGLHTWEGALEGRFIAAYLSSGGTMDEEATREGGGRLFSLSSCLRTSNMW